MRKYGFTLVLLSFTILISCTIEKRLYTKGWNVQFNTTYSNGKETLLRDSIIYSEKSEKGNPELENKYQSKKKESITHDQEMEESFLEDHFTVIRVQKSLSKQKPTLELRNTMKSNKVFPKKLNTESMRGRGNSIVKLLVIGGIMLIVGLLFLLSINGNNASGNPIVFLFNVFMGIFLTILGFVLFAIGLISLLITNFR